MCLILQSLWSSSVLWDSRPADSLGTSPSHSLPGQRSAERRRWFIDGLLSMRMGTKRWRRFRPSRRQQRQLRDVRGAHGRRTDFRIWLQWSIHSLHHDALHFAGHFSRTRREYLAFYWFTLGSIIGTYSCCLNISSPFEELLPR